MTPQDQQLMLFTAPQITDICKMLETINALYAGHGKIVITVKKGQVAAIGIEAEWRYELEPTKEKRNG